MNGDIFLEKKALRKEIKNIKKRIDDKTRRERSAILMKKLEADIYFQKAATIFIYWAMDDEIDTRELIVKWSAEKKFILPAINGNELYLKEFTGVGTLKEGDLYSIPEPEGKPFEDLESIDLAIIPGVAFDRENNRMGRGKAYYDKILSGLKGKSRLIGVCYDFQYIDKVPVEPHDIKMDGVIYA